MMYMCHTCRYRGSFFLVNVILAIIWDTWPISLAQLTLVFGGWQFQWPQWCRHGVYLKSEYTPWTFLVASITLRKVHYRCLEFTVSSHFRSFPVSDVASDAAKDVFLNALASEFIEANVCSTSEQHSPPYFQSIQDSLHVIFMYPLVI